MKTTWEEFEKTKKYPKLEKSIEADVAIIGGGITGVLNAYMLAKAGEKVVLVENKSIASYATIRTTAFLTQVIDSELSQVASLFGDSTAKKVWGSHQSAIEELERIIKEEDIKCEFVRCNNYSFASTKKQMEGIEEEFDEYKRFKIKASLGKEGDTLNFKNYGHMVVPDQAKFHVSKFVYALAQKAVKYGTTIYEDTRAVDIEEENDQIIVRTKNGNNIKARDVILATYKPLTNERTRLKKGMYVTYIFEVEIPKNTFKEGIYEDNSNPYYYFRIDPGQEHDRMIVGGEDHREELLSKVLTDKSFNGLEKFLKKIMGVRPYKITKKWYGPILEPSDGLALIGEIKPHLYVATAFSGNGMTYSTISSLIFRDLLTGKKNSNTSSWSEIYSPKRSILRPKRLAVKAKDYVEEFFAGAVKNILSN